MPEGPSLVLLKEAITPFLKKKIIKAHGNAKIDMSLLQGKTLQDIRTWGKQLFLVLKDQTVRIHLLMFGSYSINEQTKPDRSLRLALAFAKGTIYFYTCSVRLLERDWAEAYDWHADVMSDLWDPRAARKKLKALPGLMACDALLDQQIFSGSGNIIKNEVLYRVCIHPESTIGGLPAHKLGELIREVRNYSFDFLEWKRNYVLKKHWLAHTRRTCLRCELPIIKKYCGKTKRRTFFCVNCQIQYD